MAGVGREQEHRVLPVVVSCAVGELEARAALTQQKLIAGVVVFLRKGLPRSPVQDAGGDKAVQQTAAQQQRCRDALPLRRRFGFHWRSSFCLFPAAGGNMAIFDMALQKRPC